jgi:hypothetical protein
MVKVWARAGAGSAIKANNTAQTTISTKRARCRPDRASPKSAANDVDAPRHIVKLGSDKETVADPNTLLILIQPSCYEAVPSKSVTGTLAQRCYELHPRTARTTFSPTTHAIIIHFQPHFAFGNRPFSRYN